VVLPVAVVEVAGDDDEVDGFLDGARDQFREGVAAGAAEPCRGRVRVGAEVAEGASRWMSAAWRNFMGTVRG
jgi:hypothetical protein